MTVQESEESWPLPKRVWHSIQTSSSLELPGLSWLLHPLWAACASSLPICTPAVPVSYNHFHQSFPSDVFSPSNKKSGCCDSGDRHTPDLHKQHNCPYVTLSSSLVWSGARLAPDHCYIFLPETTDTMLLSRSLQFHLDGSRHRVKAAESFSY